MSRNRTPDPNQLEMSFCERIEALTETALQIAEHAHAAAKAIDETEGIETQAELHILVAAACKLAIKESGLSRQAVLEGVNKYLGRTETDGEPEDLGQDRVRAYSIHMFNNWLSKPTEYRLPVHVIHGVVKVTGDLGPYAMLVGDAGGIVISAAERAELQLGKLEQVTRELAVLKRQLMRTIRGCGQ